MFALFFTALFFCSGVFRDYLTEFGFNSCNEGGASVLTYVTRSCPRKTPQKIVNIECECSSYPGQNNELMVSVASGIVSSYHRVYYEFSDAPSSARLRRWIDSIEPIQFSCILHDSIENRAILIGDNVGSVPLWFGFSVPVPGEKGPGHFIASTDAVASSRLGEFELNSLSTNQVVIVSLDSMTVMTAHELGYRQIRDTWPELKVSAIALQLFGAALNSMEVLVTAVKHIVHNNSSKLRIIVEEDPAFRSSSLLPCVIEALCQPTLLENTKSSAVSHDAGISSLPASYSATCSTAGILGGSSIQIVRFPALVHVANVAPTSHPSSDDLISKLIGGLRDFRGSTTKIREPTMYSIALYAYEKCLRATDGNSLLVSYEMGIEPLQRSLHVYFQNWFCDMMDVKVMYPLASIEFQRILYRWKHRPSFVYQAVNYLSSTGVCCSNHNFFSQFAFRAASNFAMDSNDFGVFRRLEKVKESFVAEIESSEAHLFQLWRGARSHVDENNFVVTVMATAGYVDMLSNFLSSVVRNNIARAARSDFQSTFNGRSSATALCILVITAEEEVAELAKAAGAGVLMIDKIGYCSAGEGNCSVKDREREQRPSTGTHLEEFGTLSYQKLILARTEVILDLLLLGFNPVVADIDTVWLSDPLVEVIAEAKLSGSSRGFDMLFAADHDEVCGCFVVLNNTASAFELWSEVLRKHRQLVEGAAKSNTLAQFSDSEQKILTDLILNKEFKLIDSLKFLSLSKIKFPSGFDFFNLHGGMSRLSRNRTHTPYPAVIHNNFIIGKHLKRMRFERHGLWNVPNLAVKFNDRDNQNDKNGTCNASLFEGVSHSSNDLLATYSKALSNQLNHWLPWEWLVQSVNRRIIPSLNFVLPVHNSIIDTKKLMVQVTTEGLHKLNGTGKFWLEQNPLTSVDFRIMGVYELNMNRNKIISGFSIVLHESNIGAIVDVGQNRSTFAFDRAGQAHDIANEFVFICRRLHKERVPNIFAMQQLAENISSVPMIDNSIASEELVFTDTVDLQTSSVKHNSRYESKLQDWAKVSSKPFQLLYIVKVLAFNRPKSLRRLLDSLAAAEYLNYSVPLEISIDGNRTVEEGILVAESIKVANEFQWKFGPKTVSIRDRNQGLYNQWFNSWSPNHNGEAAFIFEDDIEVSPFFFVWASRAADIYYIRSPRQKYVQEMLLNSTRLEIAYRTKQDSAQEIPGVIEHTLSPLQQFVQEFAGEPLIYGICLQQQHVDPGHYPRTLRIQNGHRPFLYSLVGSWGPLMLPFAWQAFREWWFWKSTGDSAFEPVVETTILNYFFKGNPRIWTPWISRFAYETGGKCLYPNTPGNYSLVSNHREAGENYGESKGPSSRLIKYADIYSAKLAARQMNKPLAADELLYRKLFLSLFYYPSILVLAQWQFDFNMRRAGTIGSEKLYAVSPQNLNCDEASVHSVNRSVLVALEGFEEYRDKPLLPEYCNVLANNKKTLQWFLRISTVCNSLYECNAFTVYSNSEISTQSVVQNSSIIKRDELINLSSVTPPEIALLDETHIASLLSILESNVLPLVDIFHLGITPLLPGSLQRFISNTLILRRRTSDTDLSSCRTVTDQLKALGDNFERFKTSFECYDVGMHGEFPTQFLDSFSQRMLNDRVVILPVLSNLCEEILPNFPEYFSSLIAKLRPTYVFAIGKCATSPFQFGVSIDNRLTSKMLYFQNVEDLCIEEASDVGGVLYREISSSDWEEPNVSNAGLYYEVPDESIIRVTRRIEGGMVSSQILRREYTATFS